MSDITTTSPAGESVDISASEPLSLSAAASMLENADREEREDQTPSDDDTSNPPAETGSDDGDDQGGTDDQTDEPEGDEGEGADDNQPEDEPAEFDKLHGNTKLRLRDGSEITVGELKKRWGDLQELETARTSFTQQRQEFEQQAHQAAQQAQYFEQIAPMAIAALQSQLPQIPEMPDRSLRDTDPFTYSAMVDDRNRAIEDYQARAAEIQAIEQGQQLRHQEQTQAQQRATSAFLEQQREQLFAKMPEFKDDAKRAAFQNDLVKFGTETYGFQLQEINGAHDHRLMMVMRDAIAYRKLQAAKPKPTNAVQPQRQAPRVSQPGPRVSSGEAEARKTQNLQAQINKPGGLSLREAAALLDKSG